MRLTTVLCLLTLLPVDAQAAYSCAISTTALNFGATEGITGTSQQSSAFITVKCQADTSTNNAISYQILIYGAETDAQHLMTAGNHTTHYQVYTSGNNQQIWNSSSGMLTDSYMLNANASETRTYTVHAKINPSFHDAPGTYLDTLSVKLVY